MTINSQSIAQPRPSAWGRRGNFTSIIERSFAIFDFIRANPCCTPTEVAREFQGTLHPRTVYRYINALAEAGLIERSRCSAESGRWNGTMLEAMD